MPDPGAAVPDQSVPLLGSQVEAALDAGLRKAGVFCSICGRSAAIQPVGGAKMIEYLIVEPTIGEADKPVVNLKRLYHCGRRECDDSKVRAEAQAAREVPAWEILERPEPPEE